jgi:ribosome-associated translation inhibitor RaiA
MKIQVEIRYDGMIRLDEVDMWMEGQLCALGNQYAWSRAVVWILWQPDHSPSFEASVEIQSREIRLRTSCRGHTMTSAFTRVMAELERKLENSGVRNRSRLMEKSDRVASLQTVLAC